MLASYIFLGFMNSSISFHHEPGVKLVLVLKENSLLSPFEVFIL